MKKKRGNYTEKKGEERLHTEDEYQDPNALPEEEALVEDEETDESGDDESCHTEGPGIDENHRIAELNDKYLRLYSEFDNYRRRTLQEKTELSKTAAAGIITDLLPVLDDFDRALKAFSGSKTESTAFKDGIVLIYNKLLNILVQKGLQPMKTIGEPFDTDFHEAITTIPAPTPDMKGIVIDEVEKGYVLNGKVIRYAKVVVGS